MTPPYDIFVWEWGTWVFVARVDSLDDARERFRRKPDKWWKAVPVSPLA